MHFWPFWIYTSLSGKNCWKKIGTAIFGHSKFIPVFLGKLLEKIWNNHFWPFQIYTSLLRKIVGKKTQNGHFWPFWIDTNLSGKKLWGKIWNSHFGHSKFTPVFWGKLSEKFRLAIFGHSKFLPVFWGKIVGKNLEWPFLVILNFFQSFWEKLSGKIQIGHF